jgi:hypothetical protein
MTISATKIAMLVGLLAFLFWSFVTIGSRSWLRGFGTLVLFVVVDMLFLCMLDFILLLGH